jgi:hypothetical protein
MNMSDYKPRADLYRVTFLMPDNSHPVDVTVMRRTLREAWEWAHSRLPEASSITIEAPQWKS